MTWFLVIGGVGIALLLISLILDDHVHGIMDALGGGEWFTGASLSAFLGAFGFGGALVWSLTHHTTIAVLAGLVLGLMLGATVAWAIMQLGATQEGGAPSSANLVDRVGTVISDIPDNGFGEVQLSQGGHLLKVNARAAEPIRSGTQVTVTEVLSATAVKVVPTYR